MGNLNEDCSLQQVNVIAVEYPGYGLLQGIEPAEEALFVKKCSGVRIEGFAFQGLRFGGLRIEGLGLGRFRVEGLGF